MYAVVTMRSTCANLIVLHAVHMLAGYCCLCFIRYSWLQFHLRKVAYAIAGLGAAEAAKRFVGVMSLTWAGSQVTKVCTASLTACLLASQLTHTVACACCAHKHVAIAVHQAMMFSSPAAMHALLQ